MNRKFKIDYYATLGKKYHFLESRKYLFKMFSLRYVYFARKATDSKLFICRAYYNFKRFLLRRKYGIEILMDNIDVGFRLVHAYSITVSSKAKIGKNVTLFKGVTIGESFGSQKGAPIIGDNVWIGANSTIVGNISIGNDVLIAPNSFVNISIPDHSVVLGNPAEIHFKQNATKDYLKNLEECL